jgi:hypothetical protein
MIFINMDCQQFEQNKNNLIKIAVVLLLMLAR